MAWLTLGLAGLRGALLVVSDRLWFMNDSAEYVQLIDDLFVPRTRPPGVAVFWRGVLGVWSSPLALLLGQGLLGVLGGLVLYCIAREVGLRSRSAVVAAVVGTCTPTLLFFERVLLTETLAVFFALVTSWLVLIAVRTRGHGVWALAGLVGALGVLVRTAALIALPVFAVTALIVTRGSALRRLAAALAFTIAALVPLMGYGFASYVDSRAVTGEGRFGLQFTDGFAYFAATASLTDCSNPDKPPAIRAAVCAIPGYLDRDPDAISWGPGPVNDALRSRRYIQRNDELRQLAFESIRRDPLGFAGTVGGRTVRMLSTYDNEYSSDDNPVMAPYLRAAGLPEIQPRDRLAKVWPKVTDAWIVARLVLWVAMAVAVVLAVRRRSRGRRELLIVSAPVIVTFVWLCVTTTAVARYLLPFEPVAVLATVWLVQTLRDDRSGPDPVVADPAVAIAKPVGVG
jgi:4-amino-4-deoxy-L-arabinose transferase-like glycosyltransferase